MQDVI